MRTLLIRALLWGAIALLLTPPSRAQEEPPPTKDEVFELATLVESEKAWAACRDEYSRLTLADAEANLRRGPAANLQRMRLKELGLAKDEPVAEPESCTEATVAKLTAGTVVRVEADAGECGQMKKVTVLSGKAKDKSGCLYLTGLATAGVEARAERAKRLEELRARASERTKRRK